MSDINTIIERINNLMAIAENEASSDNEAQMAFERAQKLINEYRIEDWKRDRTRTNKPIIERGVNVSKKLEDCRIATSFYFSHIRQKKKGRIT